MKTCRSCLAEKPIDHFPINRASPDGRYRLCKLCNAEKLRQRNADSDFKQLRKVYLDQNRERVNEQARQSHRRHREVNNARSLAYREANKERLISAAKEWREKNPDRVKVNRDRWWAENPGASTERHRRRKASLLKQTPPWFDPQQVREVYALAEEFRGAGFNVHVDHIVPLRGRSVRGLYVQGNLRVCLAEVNQRKNNAWPI